VPKIDPKQPKLPGKAGPQGDGAKYYEPKAGFANYYFNRQEKTRVFAAFGKQSDLSGVAGKWAFDGEVRLLKARTTSPFNAEIKDDKNTTVTLKIGAFPESLEPLSAGADFRKPAGSGGLMAALYVWRDLLTHGEKNLSDCFNGGVEPIYMPPPDGAAVASWMNQRVDADVITNRHAAFQTKWFFAPEEIKRGKETYPKGVLLGFEMRLQELNEDPCEVYFSDYKAVNGQQMPHRMQVYYRDVHYGTFTISNYNLAKAAGN
jgi:hypothetical protein